MSESLENKVDLDDEFEFKFVEGPYFERKELKVGTSGTSSASVDDLHYYCKLKGNGDISLMMCDNDGTTRGFEIDTVTVDEFIKRFKDCSQHKCTLNQSEEDILQEKVDKISAAAQGYLEKKDFLCAEFEFGQALKLNEKDVKSNYGLGKTYLEKGEPEKASAVFEKLSHIDALFEKENKHIFNEMGIDLRKMKLYDEAIHNYQKAIQIDDTDHALFYNIARAYKEKNDLNKCKEYLQKAIAQKPDFEAGKKALAGIERLILSGNNS